MTTTARFRRHCAALPLHTPVRLAGFACLSLAAATAFAGSADDSASAQSTWRLDVELQRFDIATNTVQRPNDATGSRFDVTDYTGSSGSNARLTASGEVNWFLPHDGLRFVIAPLSLSGTAMPSSPIDYDGGHFTAGQPLEVKYKFNTYRITYDVPLFGVDRPDGWALRIGGTLAMRDAQIRLSQGATVKDFTNQGPVPLLFLSAQKRLSERLRAVGEFDAFPAPGGGGLFDGSAKLAYAITPWIDLTAGARYQFGGASDKEFYNFLRQWSVVAGVSLGF